MNLPFSWLNGSYPYYNIFHPWGVKKTPDIPLSKEVKDRLEQETIDKSRAKALKRAQNKERDRKKS